MHNLSSASSLCVVHTTTEAWRTPPCFSGRVYSAYGRGLTCVMNNSHRYDHITPLLRQLHWLKAPERVEFKLAVLVYECRQRTAPSHLFEELCQPPDFEARRRLRSASSSSLVVRRTRLSTVGDRAFPVAAARIWNGLPPHVTSAPSLPVFRSRLKTHLFRRCFP